MFKEITKELSHHLTLLGIVTVSILGALLFSYDTNFQKAIAISATLSFVSWGIIHHWLNRNLTWRIAAEYIGVGLLGLVILFSLII
jgi:Cu/Ag efflux pump CusA